MSRVQRPTGNRRRADRGALKRPRRALQLVGGLLIAVALGADIIGLGAPGTGFGRNQMMLLIGGGALIFPTLLVPERFFPNLVLKPLLLATSLYGALVLCDFALGALGPGPRQSGFVKGLYVPNDATGYSLASNFYGVDDDGYVRVSYQTNSRAHRDDEPKETTARRVLIVGDSYAFGLRLAPQQTIDKQMERLSSEGVDAYNTGVPGYGPPSVLATLKQCDWFSATDVIYFFYLNDLTTRELDINSRISRGGYIVPRAKPDGTPYSDEEIAQAIALKEKPSFRARIKATMALKNIRNLVGRLNPEAMQIADDNAQRAVDLTEEMRAVAEARNSQFLVVIIPTLSELRAGEHHPAARDFISGLQDRKIATRDSFGNRRGRGLLRSGRTPQLHWRSNRRACNPR